MKHKDGLDENDWDGWHRLTRQLGDKTQLVGDDLFVTNTERLNRGIKDETASIKIVAIIPASEATEAILDHLGIDTLDNSATGPPIDVSAA